MRIAILGTRGIPNNYGGFEQFAEYLSLGLVDKGHEVFVYNSGYHPYRDKTWKRVNLIHCYDPEDRIGTAGQFIYDFNCILDSRKQGFDIILQLGYTSNSIWHWLLPKSKSLIFTNMDGLEWKRTKYSNAVKKFLKYAERLAVHSSHFLIADSLGIQSYLKNTYEVNSKYIAYGANVVSDFSSELIAQFDLEEYGYDMLIARLEPENNIETILEGYIHSYRKREFIVIGNHMTTYGEYLKHKYSTNGVRFLGAVYDINVLNSMRKFSNLYFHGHSVGGTNPSLLEAMASEALICYHNNEFNSSIIETNGLPFQSSSDVTQLIDEVKKKKYISYIENNKQKIHSDFAWNKIIGEYEAFIRAQYERRQP